MGGVRHSPFVNADAVKLGTSAHKKSTPTLTRRRPLGLRIRSLPVFAVIPRHLLKNTLTLTRRGGLNIATHTKKTLDYTPVAIRIARPYERRLTPTSQPQARSPQNHWCRMHGGCFEEDSAVRTRFCVICLVEGGDYVVIRRRGFQTCVPVGGHTRPHGADNIPGSSRRFGPLDLKSKFVVRIVLPV